LFRDSDSAFLSLALSQLVSASAHSLPISLDTSFGDMSSASPASASAAAAASSKHAAAAPVDDMDDDAAGWGDDGDTGDADADGWGDDGDGQRSKLA